MPKNFRFTAFIVSELLRENQQGRGTKYAPSTQIRIKPLRRKVLFVNRKDTETIKK